MPDSFADDSWDELTRELGVEKSPPREPEPPPTHEVSESPLIDDEPPEDGEFDGDLGDETDAPDGTEPPSGDDPPGTGRKRRRRRRRRKKGPGEGEAAETAGEANEPAVEPVASEEPEYDSEPLDDVAGVPLAADEDAAGEMLRELIANWNVPSWDAIITGLNR